MIAEAKQIVQMPGFKGYLHDVGGPTANFRFPACKQQEEHGLCKNKRCLFPSACQNLEADHTDYLGLLRELRQLDGVKKVFVRSGLRYDYMMADRNDTFFRELVEHHISGQLKVAPEHMSDNALYYMGKPSFSVYEQFRERYARINQKLGRKQYLVPYLMSSHPGATLDDAILLAEYLNRVGYMPEQVQDFYPTPAYASRPAMYYTGLDPRTMQPVYVAKTPEEKAMQRALHPVAAAGQAADRAGGAQKSRARGPDRLRQRLSDPPAPRRAAACGGEKALRPGEKGRGRPRALPHGGGASRRTQKEGLGQGQAQKINPHRPLTNGRCFPIIT